MYALLVASRYLRRRIAAYVAVVAVMLGVAVLIVVVSVMDGFQIKIRANIRGTLSHLVVQSPEGGLLRLEEVIRRELMERRQGHVAAVSSRLQGYTLVDPAGGDHAAMEFGVIVGVDPMAEAATTGFREFLEDLRPLYGVEDVDPLLADGARLARLVGEFKDGQRSSPFPSHGPGGQAEYPGIIVGRPMYRDLHLYVGQVVNLITVPRTRERRGRDSLTPKRREFLVLGYYDTEEYAFAGTHIYMDMADAEDFLETYEPTELLVRLDDYRHAGEARSELGVLLSDHADNPFRVLTWEDLRRGLLGAIEAERSIMIILLFFIFVVAGFMIWAVLYALVEEKVRDIGVLKALGATTRGVLALFLGCGALIGVVGGALGVALGIVLTLGLNPFDDFTSKHFEWQIFPDRIYGFDSIPYAIDPAWCVKVALLGLLCSVVFAALPAWQAARRPPVEALRHE